MKTILVALGTRLDIRDRGEGGLQNNAKVSILKTGANDGVRPQFRC